LVVFADKRTAFVAGSRRKSGDPCARSRRFFARTGDQPARKRALSPADDRGTAAAKSSHARGADHMTPDIDITVTINRRPDRLNVPPSRIFADLLREDLLLPGCKIGCAQAVCGACTVLVDGLAVTACTTFAFELDGTAVTTIEGLSEEGMLHPIQTTFFQNNPFPIRFFPTPKIP